jgi:alkylhydroperoxidase family enzyme
MTSLDSLAPEIAVRFAALADCAIREAGPDLVALCERRIAQLLRADVEPVAADDRRAHVGRYPDSPLFTQRERACLAYAERAVADPGGLTDEEIAAVRAHLDDREYVALTLALTLVEARLRAGLLFR